MQLILHRSHSTMPIAPCKHAHQHVTPKPWKTHERTHHTVYPLAHLTLHGDVQARCGDLVQYRQSGETHIGMVHRIFCAHGVDCARSFVHVQRARRTELVPDYVLEDGQCATIRAHALVARVPGSGSFVASNEGVWRDPRCGSPSRGAQCDPFPRSSCDSCVTLAERTQKALPSFSIDPPALEYGGYVFHPGDGVFFAPPTKSGAWDVGVMVDRPPAGLPVASQVVPGSTVLIAVQMCGRYTALNLPGFVSEVGRA
jgi:hypothetical protein